MLGEIVRFELGVAAVIAGATVTLPSAALACLLTLWFGRLVRPTLRKTIGIASGAALPWAVWLTVLMLLIAKGDPATAVLQLMMWYMLAGLLGSLPAAFLTRQAAVMPRGRRAEDR